MRDFRYCLAALTCCVLLSSACDDSLPPSNEGGPVEAEWETWFEGPMAVDVVGANADLNVRALTLGSVGRDDNFANRGHVEVLYSMPATGPDGTGQVRVEGRFFSSSSRDLAAFEAERGRTQLVVGKGLDRSPEDPDFEACTPETGLVDGCNVWTYYAGQLQPVRVGMDIRVHLPVDFRGEVDVRTADALWPDGTYLRRSHVWISDLFGSARVELDSGEVQISLARDLLTAPSCGDTVAEAIALNAACDEYVDPTDGSPDPWNKQCGCFGETGRLVVNTHASQAADVRVDAPADAMIIAALDNAAGGSSPNGVVCRAEVACDDFTSCEYDEGSCEDSSPWTCHATLNAFPASSIAGVGYRVQLGSSSCADVPGHPGIGSYGSPAEVSRRGNLSLCSDCLQIPVPTLE